MLVQEGKVDKFCVKASVTFNSLN